MKTGGFGKPGVELGGEGWELMKLCLQHKEQK